jgi:putative peptide zinc metalloprotease protein
MSITLQSYLSLVPIEIRKDNKNFIIEDKHSGDFYEMPEVCIDAIKLLNQGERLGEIERVLKEKFPNEEVDLLDFSEQLLQLDLIAEIDGVKLEKLQKEKERLGYLAISPKVGKFFFNKFSFILYIGLFILNIILFILNPSLLPHFKDVFVFDYMFLNILLWMSLTFVLVLIHEFGHILAMRAHNLPTRLEVGHRLFLVVLETDMSTVWKLPSKARNQLFLAGLCFDTVLLTISLMAQLLMANQSIILGGIITLAALDILLRMLYQCCVYMKTDLYFVLENMSGCYNLMENAKQFINRKLRIQKTDTKTEVVFKGESNTIMLYSVFYFSGIVLTIGLFSIFYIPQMIYAGQQVLPGFQQAPTTYAFWDAAIFTLQILVVFMLLLYSWAKKLYSQ